MDVLNRKTLTVFNQLALDGIINGCTSVNWPYTGISYVVRDTFDTDVPYDLQGRPLNNNSVKGVYILNGKKYIR
jgi:hypothetical protein